jgi:glycerol-3-phosphate dehydrogenase (NAD(P)+)
MTVGFIGAGSWGTTLAVYLAENGHDVRLWSHGEEQRHRLRSERENVTYLPGVRIPDSIGIVEDIVDAASAPIVVIATPTQFIRSTLAPVDPALLGDAVVVSVSKGIERGSLLRISQMLAETHGILPERFVALSGPSHAEEVSRKVPTTVVCASEEMESALTIQDLFSSDSFRVYTSEDLLGVELGGALKNVIAVCAGITDGLGYGDNTKAALITRGLAEITRLGVSLGAHAQTFSGLSGLGDLVVTCFSRHSRNRYVGEQIGRGRELADVTTEMSMVAEGVTTTESAFQLTEKVGVEMPIIQQVYRILFEGKNAREATRDLMRRETKHEIWM